jgi:hypothetical protein
VKGNPLFITEEQAFTISAENLTAKNLPNSSDPPSKKRFTYGKFTPCATFLRGCNQGGTMSEEDFIIAVFCCVDDLLQSAPELLGVRRRGFAPRLCGSEAVTMEVVGEFLAMDSDKAVWGHFRRH